MTITVAPGVVARMKEYPGSINLQVQGASDPEAALAAVGAARAEILALEGVDARYCTAALPAGGGAFFYLDAGQTPSSVLETLPAVVARHLEAAGVAQATIAFPHGMELWEDTLSLTPRAVVLCAFLPPPSRPGRRSKFPPEWFEVAAGWVQGQLPDHAEVMVDISTMQFHLPAGQAREFFEQAGRAGPATCHLVAGDFSSTIRAANGRFAYDASLAQAAGGPQAGEEHLLDAFDELVEVARRLARGRLAYAFVSVEPDHRSFSRGSHWTEWATQGGDDHGALRHLWDEYVFDGFAYQVLSAGHLRRLGGPPPDSRPLGAGKVELAVGRPRDWMIVPPIDRVSRWEGNLAGISRRRRDPSVQRRARDLLAPCLLRLGEGGRAHRERYFGGGGR